MTIAPSKTRIGVGEVRISPTARVNVLDALDHHRLSYGPWTQRFERGFADLQRHRFACFMNSGTSALQVGLAAMKEHYGWRDGAEVLVPALTFVATLNVITQNNLRPILVDVDSRHYDIDWQQVAAILARRSAGDLEQPAAVIPVSLFGQPVRIPQIVRGFGLRVLEDSCETMFVGHAQADVTAYSTYACHLLNTGVGGFTATDDPELAALIRSLANHGRSGIYTGIDDELGARETMDARFCFERPGYSYRATELEAAIGCAELDEWREHFLDRRANADFLKVGLAGLPLQLPFDRNPGQHAYMMFPIVCHDVVDRDALTEHLERAGIETRPMLPLTSQPYVRSLFGDGVESRYPVAQRINRQGFYVGCHPYMTAGDLDHIVAVFNDYFGR